jgi:ubiquinone/menaquinone biosynthesis C-methylase UbiE
MGFYSQVIVPLLCNFGLDCPFVARYRRKLLAHAGGNVLEIGFGTGLNLQHYPAGVHKLTGVDPNPGLHRRAQERIKQKGIEVDRQIVSGERLPFEDGAFDCMVSTFTLCSVGDVAQALREVYRVLKAGGKFLFLEHGLSPEPSVPKCQRLLNWLQMQLAGGCRLDRVMRALVSAHLLLLPHGTRVVLEVDGKQHYAAEDGQADTTRYASMVAADRELKLSRYEVFRFGGAELQGSRARAW